MKLGIALRAIRLSHDLPQRKAAELSLIKPSWYSQIETNRRTPNWETLSRIAKTLDVDLWEVLFVAEVPLDREVPTHMRSILETSPKLAAFYQVALEVNRNPAMTTNDALPTTIPLFELEGL